MTVTRWTLASAASAVLIAASVGSARGAEPTVSIPVICDGIGADTVTVTGDLGAGGRARIGSGPLKIEGESGFTGRTDSGTPVTIEPGRGAAEGTNLTTCRAQESVTGPLDSLTAQTPETPSESAAKVTPNTEATGALTFAVSVDEAALVSATGASANTTVATAPFPFAGALGTYLAGRSGSTSVAVRNLDTGATYLYSKGSARNVTASIVKVQIMAAVMMRAQNAGRALTTSEKNLLSPMIKNSDNSATTSLYNSLGGYQGLKASATTLGMKNTIADSTGHWGLTTTDAVDQTILMHHFTRATGVLSSANRSYGISLMKQVSSAQDWGVTAGPPSGSVAVKNGWLPRTDGWHVNSIGATASGAPTYSIGVLTSDNPGAESTQIKTIEGVSKIIWSNRASLVAHPRGAAQDFTGNGTPDVVGINSAGELVLWPSASNGSLAAPRSVASNFGGYTWVGSPGDINRDKRADLIARASGGALTCFLSSGALTWAARACGTLPASTSITTGFTGSGTVLAIFALHKGAVLRYPLADKTGVLGSPTTMAGDFAAFNRIVNAGDLDGNGNSDLRSISTAGSMRTWRASGTTLAKQSSLSSGWQRYPSIAVSDTNRNGFANLIVPNGTSLLGRDATATSLTSWADLGAALAGGTRLL